MMHFTGPAQIPTSNIFRIVFALIAGALVFSPMFSQAATYAYVDKNNFVRTVVANDWRTAMSTAQGIHLNSGVMLLRSASDYTMIGSRN